MIYSLPYKCTSTGCSRIGVNLHKRIFADIEFKPFAQALDIIRTYRYRQIHDNRRLCVKFFFKRIKYPHQVFRRESSIKKFSYERSAAASCSETSFFSKRKLSSLVLNVSAVVPGTKKTFSKN